MNRLPVGRRRRMPSVTKEGVTGRKHKPDYSLIVFTILLLIVGLIVIYAIGPGLAAARGVSEDYYIKKQLIAIGLGLVAFTAMALIPLKFWRGMTRPLLIAAGIITLIALLLPVTPEYPARRWIRIGELSFQSAELVKFAIIFAFSAFLAERIRRKEVADAQKTFKPLLIWMAALAAVVAGAQSDLGSTVVMVAMMMAMAIVAGLPMKQVGLMVGVAALAFIVLIASSDYRRDRFMTFMQPERDCQSTGYQACQALIAVGSGGLFGKGVGHSVQAYGYLPEAANDSIFAIYAEKFGFVGVVGILALFMAFFARLKHSIERAPNDYSRLILVGILAWLSTQAFINIGAMIGVLPLKGITLPLISYGGTSIIFVAAAIGLAFNISRFTSYTPVDDVTEADGPQPFKRQQGAFRVVRPS